MRQSTLEQLGLDPVISMFQKGRQSADPKSLVDEVFGPAGSRGALVISGANGIVGAGKTMQFASRLEPYGVPVVALDLPSAPDGIGKQYKGLARSFGRERADQIMDSVVRMTYDGKTVPARLKDHKPRFLLEAIPEILDLKKAHYAVFAAAFPGIEIRSVTSGFPRRELGVGIAHPAFPHEINKVFEIVEPEPSAITKLLWALGLIPIPVGDNWSFVLDVLFCGITHASVRYHEHSNMPFWKIDKLVRRMVGPNPFRAHDAIGAAGANFLTWSCLHHLGVAYGDLFKPTPGMEYGKETGSDWYPPNHFRPLVNWPQNAAEQAEFEAMILGPIFQMAALMIHEKRSHYSGLNIIGELCAQFRKGVMALARAKGAAGVLDLVKRYHAAHTEAAKSHWHPEVFERICTPEWQQLYVNAEHDGTVGVITIGRERYNSDVDRELNRAIDWLKAEKIERAIVTGDFHFSTQLVGADTSEFYDGLKDSVKGRQIPLEWSKTARRLTNEFKTSVGFVGGKRALGGCLELLEHCHYLVAVTDAELGMPEVTLPVIPGMEGCHWPFRRAKKEDWPKILKLLVEGKPVKAENAMGWLCDFAGPMDEALLMAYKAAAKDGALPRRTLDEGALKDVTSVLGDMPKAEDPAVDAARKAILDAVAAGTGAPLGDALEIQSKVSADFMAGPLCNKGAIGREYKKTMVV
jgi:enoyl-CoA hydratase/carnithine racemase